MGIKTSMSLPNLVWNLALKKLPTTWGLRLVAVEGIKAHLNL